MTTRSLDKRTRAFGFLTRAFAAAVAGDRRATERALSTAFAAGLAPAQAFESFRMVHLFAGFPRNLTALEALHAALPKNSKNRPRARRPATRPRPSAGVSAFDRIYGSQAGAVRLYLTELDPTIAQWISEHAYGRVLSRAGLTLRERELLAVAALAVTSQEKQFASHARGALRCGATERDLLRVLSSIQTQVPRPRRGRLRDLARAAARRG